MMLEYAFGTIRSSSLDLSNGQSVHGLEGGDTMNNAIAYLDESNAGRWQGSLYAFLAEKERRSGSMRTVQSYSRMLQHFFGRVGKQPDQVNSQDVFAWGYGV